MATKRITCATCDGHRGELDHNERMWACNDCGGLGYHEMEDDMTELEAAITQTDADYITVSYHRRNNEDGDSFYCVSMWRKDTSSHPAGYGATEQEAFAIAREAYSKLNREAERVKRIDELKRQLAEAEAA